MLHLFRSPHTCTHTNTYQHTYPHMYAQHTHTHIHPHPHTRIHTTHNSQTPHTCMGCTRSLAEGAAGRPALHALSTRFDSSCKATTCLPDSCAHRHKDTAEFSVKHMNSSSCSATKVMCLFITLALYLCCSVVSPSFYFLGNIPRLLHLIMQTEKNSIFVRAAPCVFCRACSAVLQLHVLVVLWLIY